MRLAGLSPFQKPELWRHPVRALGGTALSKLHALLGEPFRGRRLAVSLVHGGVLEVELGEVLGNAILQHGVYEYATVEFMVRYLHQGDACLDVGSNIGFHAVLMGRAVGPDGGVWAFEPLPDLRSRLQANVDRNHLSNVMVRQEAVSDAEGELTLYVPLSGNNQGLASINPMAGGSRELTVPTLSLDGLIPPSQKIALMKVDVEGAEQRVFAGAARLLSREDAPSIVFEGHEPGPLVRQLETLGFTVVAIGLKWGRPCLVPWEEGRQVLRSWDTPNFLAVKSGRGRAFLDAHRN